MKAFGEVGEGGRSMWMTRNRKSVGQQWFVGIWESKSMKCLRLNEGNGMECTGEDSYRDRRVQICDMCMS